MRFGEARGFEVERAAVADVQWGTLSPVPVDAAAVILW